MAEVKSAQLSPELPSTSELYIYNDRDLAFDIANVIAPAMDRLIELRDNHEALLTKDPEGIYLYLTYMAASQLGIYRSPKQRIDEPMHITNMDTLIATEIAIDEVVDEVNEVVQTSEVDAEHEEFDRLVEDESAWTNEQLKAVCGRTISNWKRLSHATRVLYLSEYARENTHVRGIRSEVILQYTAFPFTAEYNLSPPPMLKSSDFISTSVRSEN